MNELPKELIGDFVDAAVRDQGRAEVLLQEHPGLIGARWLFNETVLHFVAVEGWDQAVEFLARHGADVNAVSRSGDSALGDVAAQGRDHLAGVLLHFGANPNAVHSTYGNVLNAAVASGNPDLVARLLAAGADPNYRTDLDESIFDAARGQPQEACEAILAVLADRGIVETPG